MPKIEAEIKKKLHQPNAQTIIGPGTNKNLSYYWSSPNGLRVNSSDFRSVVISPKPVKKDFLPCYFHEVLFVVISVQLKLLTLIGSE